MREEAEKGYQKLLSGQKEPWARNWETWALFLVLLTHDVTSGRLLCLPGPIFPICELEDSVVLILET